MKRLGMVLAIVMLFSAVFSASALADKGGNGAPSGTHFNLIIKGVANPKTADMTDSSRHTIFVPLTGRCNIDLEKAGEGETFQVTDGNCFAGLADETPVVNGTNTKMYASFMLPDPDADLNGELDYSVWYRVPPGQQGSADMTTCYYDAVDMAEYCMTGAVVHLSANKQFTDVSKQLLTVCANTAAAGETPTFQRVPLFYGEDEGDQYWWQYDNNGLKTAQLRFYPYVSGGEYGYLDPCEPGAKYP